MTSPALRFRPAVVAMLLFGLLILGTGLLPLVAAVRRCRWLSLRHALGWGLLAWLAWLLLLALALAGWEDASGGGRYLALCLTGCPGVAVLGARRPGAAAWNFVVLGLLGVLLLFWAEGLLTGSSAELGGIRLVFVAAILAAGIINYLPTRLGPAALLLAAGATLELLLIARPMDAWLKADLPIAGALFGLALWLGWTALTWPRPPQSAVDVLWLEFRDCYGLAWGQRLPEQFNRSAANANLPVVLRWHGLEPAEPGAAVDSSVAAASLATLQALMKRFGLAESGATDADTRS